jgi:hypothetical protein
VSCQVSTKRIKGGNVGAAMKLGCLATLDGRLTKQVPRHRAPLLPKAQT